MGSGGIFDAPRLQERLEELNERVSSPSFWDDPVQAQELTQERGTVERTLSSMRELSSLCEDAEALFELGDEVGHEEVETDVRQTLDELDRRIGLMEFKRMLGGPNDRAGAIVQINPGAGGTESQDWASMLLRMYLRYCERQGWKTEMVDEQEGEEAGIKGATFQVRGEYAYGYLKAETGVHRLVRISPFDANARRHTSFASVHVVPEIDDDIVVDIRDGDLRIDTYRASGAGGQHVNRTDSAVRITHLPTGVVVSCQKERSQIKNRETAMKVLRSRLYELEERKRQEEQDRLNAQKSDINFGSQIRSYVLAPYQMVKDLRTEHESPNPEDVLDGALQPFVDAWLLKFAGGANEANEDRAF
jgi:peptide chain release factor 2